MPDALQQAIVAIKTGDLEKARRLLTEILQTDPRNELAWVWLSRAVGDGSRRHAALDRALMINPENQEAQQALLEWFTTAENEDGTRPTAGRYPPGPTPAKTSQPTNQLKPAPGSNLKEFRSQLQKNLNILKEREAKYGSAAAPLDLLNQIDDYEQAIELTEEAIDRAAPLDELQDAFSTMNLQISTVVFVKEEPERKPFLGQNPYRGLQRFNEEDAKFFFGRNSAVKSLLETIQYLLATETSQQAPDLVPVLGPSGSGKSSLVRAGLIPALRDGQIDGSHHWPIKVMLPGSHPLESLAEAFLGDVGRDLAGLRKTLAGGQGALHDLMVEALAAAGKPPEAIFTLVIDQFEELFTVCDDEAERRAFIDQLLYATQVRQNSCLVILTMRSDFYSSLAAYKPLAQAVTRYQMLVSPMTEKELREAILLPAEAVGLELEKALVETLLKDTFEAPGVLPLLQHALVELFERRDGNLLTLDAYNEIGGVKGALAHRADDVINTLTAEEQPIAQRIFLRLIRLGEGMADTRRRASLDEVITTESQREQVKGVVKTLADANLIITSSSEETGQTILDVSHEALIQEWPLLRHWLNEDRQGQRIRQDLSRAAQEWQARNREEGSLYRGLRLLEAEKWVADNPDEINPLEQDFLAASVEARERAAAEKEAQRRRELEAAQRLAEEAEARREVEAMAAARLRRRAVWLAGVLGVAVLLGIAAVVFAINASLSEAEAETARDRAETNASLAATREAEAVAAEATAEAEQARAEAERARAETERTRAEAERARAEQKATLARAEQMAAQARSSVENEFGLGVLLSLEANRLLESHNLPRTIETRGSVLRTVTSHPHLARFLEGHTGPIADVALSPGGRTAASASWEGTIILWNLASGQAVVEPLVGHEAAVNSVAFSPDGALLASGDDNTLIMLWDATTGERLGLPLAGHEDLVNSVAFSPDGSILASGGEDGILILWDMSTGEPLVDPIQALDESLTSVAFSPDGQYLAIGGLNQEQGVVMLLDPETGEPLSDPLVAFGQAVTRVVFSPDNRILAASSLDGTIIMWNVPSFEPRFEAPLVGSEDWVLSLGFSPDGQYLASGSSEGTIVFWDVTTGARVGEPFTGHGSKVRALAFGGDPDRPILVSGGDNKSVIVWDVDQGLPIAQRLDTAGELIRALAYSPNGQILATGSHDGTVRLRDTTTGQPLFDAFDEHHDPVLSLAFNPQGTILASGSEDTTIILWDVVNGKLLSRLTGHDDRVRSVAFSPDGRTLASGSEDETVRLWDGITGEPIGEPLTAHDAPIQAVAFSPDGRLLASGGIDGGIGLWDVSTHEPQGEPLYGDQDVIYTVAFSPDTSQTNGDALLASGSEDSQIVLWNAATGEQIGEPLIGHDNGVYNLVFSPDGQTLASASFDKTVILWDITARRALGAPLTGHDALVDGLAFSPDGQTLASSDRNGNLILWDVRFESWQAIACERANRNLSLSEWRRFMGDEPYRRTCPDLPLHPDLIQTGVDLAIEGDIKGALAQFEQVLDLDPTIEIPARKWDVVCWFGSLWGQAADVIEVCDKAVAQADSAEAMASSREGRALARALTGDYEGAVEDLEFYVTWSEENSRNEEALSEREAWISRLKAGQNPFDKATLQQLLDEN